MMLKKCVEQPCPPGESVLYGNVDGIECIGGLNGLRRYVGERKLRESALL